MDKSETSLQDTNTTNMSIDESASNDDSIIPETQDVLSQDSISADSYQNQSDVEQNSGLEHSQSVSSVANVSGHENTTQIEAGDEMGNLDESRSKIGVQLEVTSTNGKCFCLS